MVCAPPSLAFLYTGSAVTEWQQIHSALMCVEVRCDEQATSAVDTEISSQHWQRLTDV